MVSILDFVERTNSTDGSTFVAVVIGDPKPEVVFNSKGQPTVRVNRVTITSNFRSIDEAKAAFAGVKSLPGAIVRSDKPFTYIDKETGEEKTVPYRYMYDPSAASLEEHVFERELQAAT